MEFKNDEYLWVEKYRPQKIEDIVLPPELHETFTNIVSNQELPNLLWVRRRQH